MAVSCASPEQLPSQFASPMHVGAASAPSQVGAVTITLHPPRQLTIAPQLSELLAASVQFPVHLPLHVPSQWSFTPAASMHLASHCPWQVPAHVAPLTIVVLPLATHDPVQLPEHVPLQETCALVVPSHSPSQSAWHVPLHAASTATDPSHVALALHMPEHDPEISPGLQRTVMWAAPCSSRSPGTCPRSSPAPTHSPCTRRPRR